VSDEPVASLFRIDGLVAQVDVIKIIWQGGQELGCCECENTRRKKLRTN